VFDPVIVVYLIMDYINDVTGVFQQVSAILQENVPCDKLHRYNQKHLPIYPKQKVYTDSGEKSFK
jgi:hypothetical protein